VFLLAIMIKDKHTGFFIFTGDKIFVEQVGVLKCGLLPEVNI